LVTRQHRIGGTGPGGALWSPLGGGLLTRKYRGSKAGRLTDRQSLGGVLGGDADAVQARRVPVV
jgi:aryl-alcohol dehydrogenase-like predicted oxidoreductase